MQPPTTKLCKQLLKAFKQKSSRQQDGLQQLQPEQRARRPAAHAGNRILCCPPPPSHERFEFLDRDNRGHLRSEDFEAVPELSENPIGDRIVGAFFLPGQETVDFSSFVRVLAHFRPTERNRSRAGAQPEPTNSRNRKLKFAFRLYDRDRDGKISRTELLQVLREMLGMQVTEEQLQSIADRAIQEADLDKDDAISFEEFRKSLEKVNIDHKMSIRFLE